MSYPCPTHWYMVLSLRIHALRSDVWCCHVITHALRTECGVIMSYTCCTHWYLVVSCHNTCPTHWYLAMVLSCHIHAVRSDNWCCYVNTCPNALILVLSCHIHTLRTDILWCHVITHAVHTDIWCYHGVSHVLCTDIQCYHVVSTPDALSGCYYVISMPYALISDVIMS